MPPACRCLAVLALCLQAACAPPNNVLHHSMLRLIDSPALQVTHLADLTGHEGPVWQVSTRLGVWAKV